MKGNDRIAPVTLDLLMQMLTLNPNKRITAKVRYSLTPDLNLTYLSLKAALQHPHFDWIKEKGPGIDNFPLQPRKVRTSRCIRFV